MSTSLFRSVSILGCGWLGLPLGARLVEQGYRVNGSTTTESKLPTLEAVGIRPWLLNYQPRLELPNGPGDFFASQVLVLNVPPARTLGAEYYLAQLRAILADCRKSETLQWVVFLSSTGVYGAADPPPVVTEADLPAERSARQRLLLEAETLVQESPLDSTVLRLGGLYGGDRHPVRYVAGRVVEQAEAPVNFLYLADAVGVIQQLLRTPLYNRVYNVVAPQHPTRRAVYTAWAEVWGVARPEFAAGTRGKQVSCNSLLQDLGYAFQQPDPAHPLPPLG